jgi:hypothetical protein
LGEKIQGQEIVSEIIRKIPANSSFFAKSFTRTGKYRPLHGYEAEPPLGAAVAMIGRG